MSTSTDEFLAMLRATFKLEAEEHLQTIAGGLLELEKTPGAPLQGEIVETIFRAAHSLKGAARAVEYSQIESLCQSLEDIFAAWRREESAPSLASLDVLHSTLNTISGVLAASQGPQASQDTDLLADQRAPAQPSRPAARSDPPSPKALAASPAAPRKNGRATGETVRISVDRLDARLVQAEEMLTVKLGAAQSVDNWRDLLQHFSAWRDAWAVVEQDALRLQQKIDLLAPSSRASAPADMQLRGVLEFLGRNQERLKQAEQKVATFAQAAGQNQDSVSRLVDDLLEESKRLLLLPFSTMAASFPKLVRDQCRDQGKQADLKILGESVEVDKRILEAMKDPLIHLLRNSVDHGVEAAAERTRRGKPPRATIKLTLSQIADNKLRLTVSDDGAGIDTAKVKASAVRQGLISDEEAQRLGEAEAQALIFRSSLSTSPSITTLSGRGLGLAIVREKVFKLGGDIWVDSQQGLGTVFRIELPMSRASFRGLVVSAAGLRLVLPLADVARVARVGVDDIRTVKGCEVVSLDDRAVSLVRLADVLELPPGGEAGRSGGGLLLLVLGRGDQQLAFVVDEVLGEHEILVKPLLKPLSRVRNVASAAVLGTGQVVPILNTVDLLKSAVQSRSGARRVTMPSKPQQVKTVLVAEDSITSRMLIKGILESAGYQVTTAVDGMDAFTQLRAGPFDLLVSDVEMPRLNGFDLTARIRADRKLAELPVILVTALETREDRERGIDVGANAYIGKGSFDQRKLIDAVRQLV